MFTRSDNDRSGIESSTPMPNIIEFSAGIDLEYWDLRSDYREHIRHTVNIELGAALTKSMLSGIAYTVIMMPHSVEIESKLSNQGRYSVSLYVFISSVEDARIGDFVISSTLSSMELDLIKWHTPEQEFVFRRRKKMLPNKQVIVCFERIG